MREFDVVNEQPHSPGYIVYVWICNLVDLAFGDAQTTMVWISVFASALVVVAFFCLGRSIFGRSTGLVAALILASSPLIWFYGEIALPHTLDTLLVIVGLWWLYETMQGNHHYLIPAIIVLAIAGGVRQQTLVFLAPLLLFTLRRVGWKRFLAAGALGVVLCLVWFIPLIVSSGGLSNYLNVMSVYGGRFQDTTSIFMGAGWGGIKHNVRKLAMYTLYGWNLALVPVLIYVVGRLWRREWPRRWEELIFLVLWIAPALTFYTIIHMGLQGLVFIYLPALLLSSAFALTRLLAGQSRWLVAATASLVILNAGIFLLVPEYPLGEGTQRMLTRATLINSDHYYQDRFDAILDNFSPQSTAILAIDWHHVEYYLPDYELLAVDVVEARGVDADRLNHRQGEERLDVQSLGLTPDADGQVNIVEFGTKLAPFSDTPEVARVVELAHGGQMSVFALSMGQALYVEPTFGVVNQE
jgi:hypothetical protein